ncbi:MAG: hypothetical protein ACREX9_19815 [Gammaproteobacteria bacterium]
MNIDDPRGFEHRFADGSIGSVPLAPVTAETAAAGPSRLRRSRVKRPSSEATIRDTSEIDPKPDQVTVAIGSSRYDHTAISRMDDAWAIHTSVRFAGGWDDENDSTDRRRP